MKLNHGLRERFHDTDTLSFQHVSCEHTFSVEGFFPSIVQWSNPQAFRGQVSRIPSSKHMPSRPITTAILASRIACLSSNHIWRWEKVPWISVDRYCWLFSNPANHLKFSKAFQKWKIFQYLKLVGGFLCTPSTWKELVKGYPMPHSKPLWHSMILIGLWRSLYCLTIIPIDLGRMSFHLHK